MELIIEVIKLYHSVILPNFQLFISHAVLFLVSTIKRLNEEDVLELYDEIFTLGNFFNCLLLFRFINSKFYSNFMLFVV
jgi:hypothetical protein